MKFMVVTSIEYSKIVDVEFSSLFGDNSLAEQTDTICNQETARAEEAIRERYPDVKMGSTHSNVYDEDGSLIGQFL